MRLLLDTHALLWWLGDDKRLGREARASIKDPKSIVWVSAATAWEIAIKVALGRLDLGEPPEDALPRELARSNLTPLPITTDHALAVRTLPRHHADPFDRMLVAQARMEDLILVTADAAIGRYDVRTLPASR